MIGIIAAVTVNGVIGLDNKLPFDYSEDMKHFRKTTTDSVVIMGRKTYEGIGRPLPKRRNIVVSKIAKGLGTLKTDGIETASSIKEAMELCSGETRNIWFIGGASVYEEGMLYADKIVLTQTPDYEHGRNAIRFPWINPLVFERSSTMILDEKMWEEGTSRLYVTTYDKRILGLDYEKIISQAKLHTM
jgi:dihydrofolate reductase